MHMSYSSLEVNLIIVILLKKDFCFVTPLNKKLKDLEAELVFVVDYSYIPE